MQNKMRESPSIFYCMDYNTPPNFWLNGLHAFRTMKENFGDEIFSPFPSWEIDESNSASFGEAVLKIRELELKDANPSFINEFSQKPLRYSLETALIEKSIKFLKVNPKKIETIIFVSELNSYTRSVFDAFPHAKPIFASMSDNLEEYLKRWSDSDLAYYGLDKIQLLNVSDVPSFIEKDRLKKELPFPSLNLKFSVPRL